ncbi:MAG: hypothetical protein Ct9H300mP4_10130 [Gammaproteobacteria bacterium]|nr:MAG: hypothetical protein Ct9H300mP4_10130 [Gammaproteobacteria bacterium]
MNSFWARFYNKSMILIRIEKFIKTQPLFRVNSKKPICSLSIESLFGESAVLMKEKINFKPPGAPPDLLHQDSQADGTNMEVNLFLY